MIFALVAMVMMTMSANAQSNDNNSKLTFDRLASYLELTVDQVEPVKTAMAQFESSMEALYQNHDAAKGGEAWEKIQAPQREAVQQVCSDARPDSQEHCRTHSGSADGQQMIHSSGSTPA